MYTTWKKNNSNYLENLTCKSKIIFSVFESSQSSEVHFFTAKVSKFSVNKGQFYWNIRIFLESNSKFLPFRIGLERDSNFSVTWATIHWKLLNFCRDNLDLRKIRIFQFNPGFSASMITARPSDFQQNERSTNFADQAVQLGFENQAPNEISYVNLKLGELSLGKTTKLRRTVMTEKPRT